MKNKKFLVPTAIVAGIMTLATSLSAFAANGDQNEAGRMGLRGMGERPEMTEEMQAEMEVMRAEISEALESGNYSEWVELMEDHKPDNPMVDEITEDEFPDFMEAHKKMEDARELMEGIGVEGRGFGHGGMGKMGKMGRGFNHDLSE